MNILIESRDQENFLYDQFFVFSSIPLIKLRYPDAKIYFGVAPFFYDFFSNFSIIDHVQINSMFGVPENYINFPKQFVGKFSDDSALDKLYHYGINDLQNWELSLKSNLFGLKGKTIDRDFVKSEIPIVAFINFNPIGYKNEEVIVKKYIADVRYEGAMTVKDGVLHLSLFDLFEEILDNQFDVIVCDPFIGSFFSTLSSAYKVIVGEDPQLNENVKYFYYSKKFLGISTYNYVTLKGFDMSEVETEINNVIR
jgi:hypothetical protein